MCTAAVSSSIQQSTCYLINHESKVKERYKRRPGRGMSESWLYYVLLRHVTCYTCLEYVEPVSVYHPSFVYIMSNTIHQPISPSTHQPISPSSDVPCGSFVWWFLSTPPILVCVCPLSVASLIHTRVFLNCFCSCCGWLVGLLAGCLLAPCLASPFLTLCD